MIAYPPTAAPKSCDARLEMTGGCERGSISNPGCRAVAFNCTKNFGHSDGKHGYVASETTLTVTLEWYDVKEGKL
jgi:hypothetical protein